MCTQASCNSDQQVSTNTPDVCIVMQRSASQTSCMCMRVYLDVVLRGVEIFVNLGQTAVHVPQKDHTQRGRGAQHAWRGFKKLKRKFRNHSECTEVHRSAVSQRAPRWRQRGSSPWSLFLYSHLLPSSVSNLSCPNAALTKPFTKDEAKFMRAESTWEPLPPNPVGQNQQTLNTMDGFKGLSSQSRCETHCCFPGVFCRCHLGLLVP